MDMAGKHVSLSVLFDVVKIEIRCGSNYEAQVMFDDIADTVVAGGSFTISGDDAEVTKEK